ncbi:hypothetical protein [Sphingomonas sp.]|jgi:hypothetical protein|uniref:tetratricopeptide repeat protein n=1 Tax=Sphingomonas sp. TaxID=28214 RepID=UPI002ED7E9CA
MRVIKLFCAAVIAATALCGAPASAQKAVRYTKPWACNGAGRVAATGSAQELAASLAKAPTRANWKIFLCNFRQDARTAKRFTLRQDFALAILSPLVDPVDGPGDVAEAADKALYSAYVARTLDNAQRAGFKLTPAQIQARDETAKTGRDDLASLPGIEERARERRDPRQLLIAAEMYFAAGNWAKSADLYTAALAAGLNGPDVPMAQTFLAILMYQQGDKAGAVKRFRGVDKTSTWGEVAQFWLTFLNVGIRG